LAAWLHSSPGPDFRCQDKLDWQTQLIADVALGFVIYVGICCAGFLIYMWLIRRG
jgi:hypothetical protein